MTDSEYIAAQRALVYASAMLNKHDWSAFNQRVKTAQAVGPILDPTLYIKASDNLSRVAKVARSAGVFVAEANALPEEVIAEAVMHAVKVEAEKE